MDLTYKTESAIYKSVRMYQALIGSLTYAATSMCPDIGYITQFLSQANKDPRPRDWDTSKRVLRYLKGTRGMGIIYQRDPDEALTGHDHMVHWGYCDANYAKDAQDQRLTSGYMFMLAGGPISWKLKKQPSISLSTTEAEYYALGIAFQEATWIRHVYQEIFKPLNNPVLIYSDNAGAVALSKNPIFHNRSKHIDICWHYIRDLIRSKVIRSSHIPGINNGADFLTKALSCAEHERCAKFVRME